MNSPTARQTCTCGWVKPLIAVTNQDGSPVAVPLVVSVVCARCGAIYAAGELFPEMLQKHAVNLAAELREALRRGMSS